MHKKLSKISLSLKKLPDAPGVYFFLGENRRILYIGKATSLKDRVKSYFAGDILKTRSPLIAKMLEEATKVEFKETDSVLEALLLEAQEIRRHKPPYNSKEKDDKSHNHVVITKEAFPRILIIRGRELEVSRKRISSWRIFGPFPHGSELREALKIVRKIFPFRDKCKPGQKRPCFNYQIGLCPGVCSGKVSSKDYKKSLKQLILFFEGKKKRLVRNLRQEMDVLARKEHFEEAQKIKKQIFALEHIRDVALLKKGEAESGGEEKFRIEAYDVAHISGRQVVGVMTVVENGEVNKSEYRKFKIKTDKNNDTANLREVLIRRLSRTEWSYPDLIVIDGGRGQINTAKRVLEKRGLSLPVVSVVKDERHRPREILGRVPDSSISERQILLANAEAHRFAIGYHRQLRGKGFRL